MVQLSGKYKLVENKNLYEFLLGIGVPEDKAQAGNALRGTLEVTVDGNKITMENDAPKSVTNFVVGQEVDETFTGTVFKSTTTVSGDTITVTSKTSDGQPTGGRTFLFSDDGLEEVIKRVKDGKTLEASRFFKRI